MLICKKFLLLNDVKSFSIKKKQMPVGKDKIKFYLAGFIKSVFSQNYFIALCASGWYLSSVVLINNTLGYQNLAPSLFVFFSTVLMYNLDRMFGDDWNLLKLIFKTPKSLTKVLRKTVTKLIFQIFFLVPLIWLFSKVEGHFLKSLVAPAIVAVLYALPIGKNELRLRELPFVKIFAIAFVWAWIGSFLAASTYGQKEVLLFLERFLFIYALTIPFDLRDIKADQGKKINTIPIRMGPKYALRSALIAIGILWGLLFLFNDAYTLPKMIVSIFALVLVIAWSRNRTWVYYLFFIDGCILLQSIAILLQFQL